MKYLDSQFVEAFRVEAEQAFTEAIEFAVAASRQDSVGAETDRQAAQDAMMEIVPSTIDAVIKSYKKSQLEPDYPAISLIFQKMAIRMKLVEIAESKTPSVLRVTTRKGKYEGTFPRIVEDDGEEIMCMVMDPGYDPDPIPLVAILDVEVL